MIYGIGTDVVEIARIERALARFGDDFPRRILTPSEMLTFTQLRTQARFIAKRFAAKEAFAKAMGTGFRGLTTLQNISVLHDDLGKPQLHLSSKLQSTLDRHGISSMHLSISDEKALAIAFVILECE